MAPRAQEPWDAEMEQVQFSRKGRDGNRILRQRRPRSSIVQDREFENSWLRGANLHRKQHAMAELVDFSAGIGSSGRVEGGHAGFFSRNHR